MYTCIWQIGMAWAHMNTTGTCGHGHRVEYVYGDVELSLSKILVHMHRSNRPGQHGSMLV